MNYNKFTTYFEELIHCDEQIKKNKKTNVFFFIYIYLFIFR